MLGLFEKASVITKTTGQRALNALLTERQVQRIGKGGMRQAYRYFRETVFGKSLDEFIADSPSRGWS